MSSASFCLQLSNKIRDEVQGYKENKTTLFFWKRTVYVTARKMAEQIKLHKVWSFCLLWCRGSL
jgi:hypothetical protein